MVSIKNNARLSEKIKQLEDTLKYKEDNDNQIIADQAAKLTKRRIRNSKLKQKLKLRNQRN